MIVTNKDRWINVYAKKYGDVWYGLPYPKPYTPFGNLKRMLLYRIHVRLK